MLKFFFALCLAVAVIVITGLFFVLLAFAIFLWDWLVRPKRTFAERINYVNYGTHLPL